MRALLIALLLACGGISHADCGPNKTPLLCLPFTNWGPVNEAFSRIDMYVGRLYGAGNTRGFVVTDEPWNADNTGQTDTTVDLQAAATACEAAGGGTISVPPGTYLTRQVTIGSGCTLEGPRAAIIKCVATEPDACIFLSQGGKKMTPGSTYGNPVSNTRVTGITIDGNGTARIAAALGGYVRSLVVAHRSDNVTIDHVRFVDGGSRALEVNPSRSVWVTDNVCENSSHVTGSEGDCLHVGNPDFGAATNQPPDWGDAATDYQACRDIHVNRNTVLRHGDTAISAQFCLDVDIGENIIRGDETFACTTNADCGTGGTCSGSNRCTPTADESGIEFVGAQHVRVHDNTVHGVRNSCITTSAYIDAASHEWDPTDISVTDNTCIHNPTTVGTSPTIRVQGGAASPAYNVKIDGNTIQDSPVEAISLPIYVTNFTISHNILRNVGTTLTHTSPDAAIRLASATTSPVLFGTVDHNVINGSPGDLAHCIFSFYTSAATGVSITNNDCDASTANPIRVEGTGTFVIHDRFTTAAQITHTFLSNTTYLGNAQKGSRVYCNDCTYDGTTGICNTGGTGTAGRWAWKKSSTTGEWCCQSGGSLTTCQ